MTCAPEIQKLFESVARSCMVPRMNDAAVAAAAAAAAAAGAPNVAAVQAAAAMGAAQPGGPVGLPNNE